MIFNFTKLRNLTKILLIFIICGDFYYGFSEDSPFYAATVAQNLKLPKDQSFSKQIDYFLHHLKKATKDECDRIFGNYNTIISHELDYKKLFFVSYEEVDNLLDQAANESIDSLTLFTLPPLQDQRSFAIVFNEELLEEVQRNYNFHALFNISAQPLDDGPVVKMKFLVIGQRKLIVGYNRNAKIKHPDYDFATGKYDYKELFTMDTRNDSNETLGLYDIKGLSHPNGKPQWMKGPLNVDIQSLIITSDSKGQKKILIQYDLFGIKQKLIDPIPIEKLFVK